MEFIPAKNIISGYVEDGWFGANYNMNIYKGCSHGCIYCDSRSECYQIKDFSRVRAKADALKTIERNLRSKQKKGVVGTGGMSDPYNPMEKKYELTRGALKLFDRYHFGISSLTKSDLVVRDTDLFLKIARHSPANMMMTITAADDQLAQKIEPYASSTSARFKAIKTFSKAGIHTGVLMMPLLPFIEDTFENILGLIHLAKENGADFIYPSFSMTLRSGQREYFYRELDRKFPGLSRKYIDRYGGEYGCPSPDYDRLKERFIAECNKLNMTYRYRDIITYKSGFDRRQLSFL